jgi:hypothetical protein
VSFALSLRTQQREERRRNMHAGSGTNLEMKEDSATEGRDLPRWPSGGSSSGNCSGALVVSLRTLEGILAPQEREHIVEQVRNSAPGKLRKIYQSSISMTEEELEIAESGRANIIVRDQQLANMVKKTCREAIIEVLPPLPRAMSASGRRDDVVGGASPSFEKRGSDVL